MKIGNRVIFHCVDFSGGQKNWGTKNGDPRFTSLLDPMDQGRQPLPEGFFRIMRNV
jgi:hypothetical protein